MASGYAQPPVARATRESQDFARLERAVRALAAEHALLRGENVELREKLDQATVRIRSQDERILAENQRRQDVLKRLDELLGRIEQRSPEPAGAHAGRR
jgi:chromosome segregation ATPase